MSPTRERPWSAREVPVLGGTGTCHQASRSAGLRGVDVDPVARTLALIAQDQFLTPRRTQGGGACLDQPADPAAPGAPIQGRLPLTRIKAFPQDAASALSAWEVAPRGWNRASQLPNLSWPVLAGTT
jgi:hypothetical protein